MEQAKPTPPPASIRWTVLFVLLFVILLLGLGFALHGKTGLEKILTLLSFPVGLMWLGLTGWVIHRLGQRRWQAAVGAACAWLLFTLLGSSPVSNALMRVLESRESSFQPGIDPDLDVLVVLGGGTRQGPNRAQAARSGDRVVLAAQLYLQGRAKRLITTGDSTPGLGGQRTGPQQHSIEIWRGLGIDEAAIGRLSGVNTYQEIQSLKALRAELAGQRVGLLTSAYHLPRAMRLARAAGLNELIPVAADYQSHVESYALVDLLPSAGAFDQIARCQHEILAYFVSR